MKFLKGFLKFIYYLLVLLVLFAGLAMYTGSQWYAKYYSDVPFAQVVYHLYAPLEGSDTGFLNGIQEYLVLPISATVIALIVMIVVNVVLKKKEGILFKRIRRVFNIFVPVLSICALLIGGNTLYSKMGVDSYVKNTEESTELYERYYVNGNELKFEFPETKRNLVYIFLESMEVTFEGSENGGLTETDYIPELTKLQNENTTFNGGDVSSNGYYVPSLSGWTVAGIVGQTSGTPLNVASQNGNALTSGDFLPNAFSIGQLLEAGGYTQKFICGSDITFGGRKNYLDQHGNYEYIDHEGAKKKGYIPQDYAEWWGYEDSKLFDIAKKELDSVSKESAPFNVTLLTADTHFPYGYTCSECGTAHDKNYSNVLSCSSKRVNEFVKWCQSQSWYENTTIVIAGDHTTMDTDWFSDKDASNYQRKAYYTIINPAVTPERSDARKTCTYDLFPTTVAALGITYDGNRLGLGTNLFSSEDTLVEIYGAKEFNAEIQLQSAYYDKLFNNRDDLFKYDEPQNTGDAEYVDDYSWQVPTYYTGEVYNYTELEPVVNPEPTTDVPVSTDQNNDTPADPGTDPTTPGDGGGDIPEPTDPTEPVTPDEPVVPDPVPTPDPVVPDPVVPETPTGEIVE